MVNPNRFYTYAYLRDDRTPYYIGKGSGNRINDKTARPCGKPKDKSRIIFLKQNLTEEEAFRHEIYMIDVFGRKDLGTGILINRTNGGEGVSGRIQSDETRKKISDSNKGKRRGKKHSEESKRKISEARKGKPRSEETKRKMSESTKGRKGKPHSEETKRKISERKKSKK